MHTIYINTHKVKHTHICLCVYMTYRIYIEKGMYVLYKTYIYLYSHIYIYNDGKNDDDFITGKHFSSLGPYSWFLSL